MTIINFGNHSNIKKLLKYFGIIIYLPALCISLAGNAQASTLFSDDFRNGIDSTKWVIENNGESTWVAQTEANGDGYITAQPQSNNDRFTDISTAQNNFSDFDLTLSMRFENKGSDHDHRRIYFRCDNSSPEINGYIAGICLGYPGNNHDAINIGKYDSEHGTWALNAYVADLGENYFQLSQWYNFKLEAIGNTLKIKEWREGTIEPDTWLLSVQDTSGTPAFNHGGIGFGNYWQAQTGVTNINISSIAPEPPSSFLFLFGLSGLLLGRKKIRKAP